MHTLDPNLLRSHPLCWTRRKALHSLLATRRGVSYLSVICNDKKRDHHKAYDMIYCQEISAERPETERQGNHSPESEGSGGKVGTILEEGFIGAGPFYSRSLGPSRRTKKKTRIGPCRA